MYVDEKGDFIYMKSKIAKKIRKMVRRTATGASFLYLGTITPRLFHRPPRMSRSFYAHRGLHDVDAGIPENTMTAMKRAIEHGYGIELDVQLTKDEKVVVFHDFNLKRVCGVDIEVDALTYEELQQYPVSGTQERIPLFSEVLNLVDGRVPLIVELKMKTLTSPICEKADEILESYKGEYCIESFHPKALWWYRMNRPQVCRGQLSMNFRKDHLEGSFYGLHQHLIANFLVKPDFIAYDCRSKKEISLFLCRNLFGCPAYAWTVKSEQELGECRDYFDCFIFEGFLPEVK
jgi:glycerophosphoryl diester phosphodiesterase